MEKPIHPEKENINQMDNLPKNHNLYNFNLINGYFFNIKGYDNHGRRANRKKTNIVGNK